MRKKLFIIILCMALCLSLVACSNSDAPVSDKEKEGTVAVATPPPEPVVENLKIGDMTTLGDWEMVVTGSQFTTEVDNGYGSFSPDEGNQFLVVSLSITNNGKEAATFLPSFRLDKDISAKVIYAGEYEYTATNLMGYDKELHDAFVNPLSSKDGNITFELPDKVINSEEEIVISIYAGGDEVTFKLR